MIKVWRNWKLTKDLEWNLKTKIKKSDNFIRTKIIFKRQHLGMTKKLISNILNLVQSDK